MLGHRRFDRQHRFGSGHYSLTDGDTGCVTDECSVGQRITTHMVVDERNIVYRVRGMVGFACDVGYREHGRAHDECDLHALMHRCRWHCGADRCSSRQHTRTHGDADRDANECSIGECVAAQLVFDELNFVYGVGLMDWRACNVRYVQHGCSDFERKLHLVLYRRGRLGLPNRGDHRIGRCADPHPVRVADKCSIGRRLTIDVEHD